VGRTGSAAYLGNHVLKVNIIKIDLGLIARAADRIERRTEIHYGTMAFKALNDMAARRSIEWPKGTIGITENGC